MSTENEQSRVRRLPVLDEYVEDGHSAVLLQGQVLALSAIATAVLALLSEEWSSTVELLERVEVEIGAPEDGETAGALDAVLNELVGHALVERG